MCVRCVCVKGSEDPMRPMVCFCVVQMLLNSTTFLDRFQLGEKASNESDVAAGTLLNIIVFFFLLFFYLLFCTICVRSCAQSCARVNVDWLI